MDPHILQSLQEIASLLLLVHDYYLKESFGSDVLVALVTFLEDVNLSKLVSVIDAEKLRRAVMRFGETQLGYELFYEWLRGVAQMVYHLEDLTGKRALHHLLTQYIMPCASQIELNYEMHRRVVVKNPLPFYTDSALRIMVANNEFLCMWYLSLLNQQNRLRSEWERETVWSAIAERQAQLYDVCTSLRIHRVVVADTEVLGGGSRRGVVSEGDLESILLLCRDSSATTLTFPAFLYLLELLAERTDSFAGETSAGSDGSRLERLLEFAAHNMFRAAAQSFSDTNTFAMVIDATSLLQWLRQARLSAVSAADVSWQYEQLTIYADYSHGAIPRHTWRVVQLPYIICSILGKLAAIYDSQSPFCVGGNRRVDSGECVRCLMGAFPELFFASRLQFPQLVAPLFQCADKVAEEWRASEHVLSAWHQSLGRALSVAQVACRRHSERLQLTSKDGVAVPCCRAITASDLSLYFQSRGELVAAVCPQLLDESLVRDVCCSVATGQAFSRSKMDAEVDVLWVSQNSLVEVLFVVVHSYYGAVKLSLLEVVEDPRFGIAADCAALREGCEEGGEDQFSAAVFELVLLLVRLLVGAVAQSIPLPATSLQKRDAKLPPIDSRIEVVQHATQGVGEEMRTKNHVSAAPSRTLEEVAVLLAHFPVTSFAHNPWDVAQLFALASGGGPADSDTGLDTGLVDESLTNRLRLFGAKYGVSADSLSLFFAEHYSSAAAIEALRCPSTHLLMRERTLRLLFLNADLLKWEFGRCLAAHRVTADPFTDGVCVPLAVSSTDETGSMHCDPAAATNNMYLISWETVESWALQNSTGLDPTEVRRQVDLVASLSGSTVLSRGYVSFSSFIILAVRCFTCHLFTEAKRVPEEAFVQEVRRMLQVFSRGLSDVQQSLRIRVLRLLFGPEAVYSPISAGAEDFRADCTSVLQASLVQFDKELATPPPVAGRRSVQWMPPRPPAVFWDPPRFVQFCKQTGILSSFECSVEMCWVAFGLALRELSPKSGDLWDVDVVVPPIPVAVDNGSQTVIKLLQCLQLLAEEAFRGEDEEEPRTTPLPLFSICFKTIAPLLCVDPALLLGESPLIRAAKELPQLEDLLRYGGSEAMRSLAGLQDFLLMAYFSLCEQSKECVESPFHSANSDSFVCEATLALVCKFFSCGGALRSGMVAVQAKRALHPRLRPVYLSKSVGDKQKAAIEVVTISFPEFEELFVRCAFALWEESDAISSPAHLPRVDFTPAGKAVTGSVTGNQQLFSRVWQVYSLACEQVGQGKRLAEERRAVGRGKRTAWGTDFIAPFSAVLRGFVDLPKQSVEPMSSIQYSSFLGGSKDEARQGANQFQTRIRNSFVQESSLALPRQTQQQSSRNQDVLSDIVTGRLKHLVADPAIRWREDVTPKLHPAQISSRSTGSAATSRVFFGDDSYSSSSVPTRKVGSGNNSFGDSPKTLLTSQEVISSSSERVQLLQESSDQFVGALEELLAGTKEALWPVYATYCSCGDSVDPGKLSGSNLFTLLSKLGVLTDRTLLSDVGILLHQISSHSQVAVNMATVSSLGASSHRAGPPSLTFEEFLVFLCAFSQLRFEGVLVPPRVLEGADHSPENWFKTWQQFMASSQSFRRLLVECILPVLKKRTLLAFPEDARLRDRFTSVFAVEVLQAVEGVEGPLQLFFERLRTKTGGGKTEGRSAEEDEVEAEVAGIMDAMRRIRLVPNVVHEAQVLQLMEDVLPETRVLRGGLQGKRKAERMLFPQWEWVLSVVAVQAVETAIEQSATGFSNPEKIPLLVADVVASIASAMTSGQE